TNARTAAYRARHPGSASAQTEIVKDAKGQRLIDSGTGATIRRVGGPTPRSASSGGAPKGTDINKLVDQWKNGKPSSVTVVAKDASGNPIRNADGVLQTVTQTGVQGKLSYRQAYRKLRALKIGDAAARRYLDTAYKRGEQGRA